MRDLGKTNTDRLTERASPGLHEALLEHLPAGVSSDAPILDVGCGTGAWLARLAGRGFKNLTGIDYDTDQTRIKAARIERVDLNEADWAPISGRFALVTAIEVVEHVENLGIFFDCLAHVVDDGGTILITTPNVESLASRLRFLLLNQLKQFDSIGDSTHIVPVLTATLPRIIGRHGLRVAECWGYPSNGRTLTSRGWVNLLCAGLRLVLPEPIGGDNLCLKLVKV